MAKQDEKIKTQKRKSSTKTEENEWRKQPQAPELEEAVLGALMLEKDALSIVGETLKPESFYVPSNGLIFQAIQNLAKRSKPIDVMTVTEQLKLDGTLEEAGGASFVARLSQKVVSSAHLDYHARIVAQKYLARELISFSSQVTNQAFDETNDVDDLMQEAEAKLFEITQQNVKKDVIHIYPIINDALTKIREAFNSPEGLSGLQTGFKDLDKITQGWQSGDLIIIAARPAMGKTAFVLSMVKNMAVNYNTPVAVFSLEMPNVQLVNRLISNISEIRGDTIRSGKLQPYEWQQLDSKVNELYNAPIYVDDTASLSVFELRSKARRLVKEHGVKCIFIDYLQLMNASGMMSWGSNRENEVSTISRNLKGLAKELDIPIIALSQLNRRVEDRTGTGKEGSPSVRLPQLSDLRESGAIEQDADIVCFIHRPEKYGILEDERGHDMRGKAMIIIAKHRNGQTGEVMLEFVDKYVRFQNLDENKSLEDIQSRVSSLENVMPEERHSNSSDSRAPF
jgi:replicative DNA helicase